MSFYATYFLGSVFAGFLQTVTGFGAGIVLVLMLSASLGLLAGPAVVNCLCLVINILLTCRYCKQLEFKLIAVPSLSYLVSSLGIVYLVPYLNVKYLAILFGLFLVTLSVYYLFFSKYALQKPSLPMAIVCGFISGIFAGLFGVGGPLMAVYLINTSKSKEAYIGNLNALFTFAGVFIVISKLANGLLTPDLIPLTLVGAVAVFLGCLLGDKAAGKIEMGLFKKIIYVYVGISGIITLINYAH